MRMSSNNKLLSSVDSLLSKHAASACAGNTTHTLRLRLHAGSAWRERASMHWLQRLQSELPVAAESNRHRYSHASPHSVIRLLGLRTIRQTVRPSVLQYPAERSYAARVTRRPRLRSIELHGADSGSVTLGGSLSEIRDPGQYARNRSVNVEQKLRRDRSTMDSANSQR